MRIKKLLVELAENEQFQFAHRGGRMLVLEIELRGRAHTYVRLHGWTVPGATDAAPSGDGGRPYEDEKLRPVDELPEAAQKLVQDIVAGSKLWEPVKS